MALTARMPASRRMMFLLLVTCVPLFFFGRAAYRSHLRSNLFQAVDRGDATAVRALLDSGIDPNTVEKTPESTWRNYPLLLRAFRQRRGEVAEVLIEKGADVNAIAPDSLTALHAAIAYRQFDMIALLLRHGADVNAINPSRPVTALQLASGLPPPDHDKVYRLLLQHGARLLPVEAASNGDAESLAALLKSGADPNQTDSSGSTALYHAAFRGRTDMVRMLLAAGAEVNKPSVQGMTPLMAAIGAHSRPIVKLLLAAGADVNAMSYPGDTALRMTRYRNLDDVARLLKAHGAVR